MKPQMLSWLICDAVHIDPATGKQYILGVFSHIRSRAFPFRHPRMLFLLTIAGLREGKHRLKITMGLPMEPQQTLVDREFESPGPMQKINLLSEMQGLGFNAPGNYAISIDIDDENLFVTSFPVLGPGTEVNN
ncbi:MAG TPA: hypothetical protein PKI32_02450 [Opitutales bacterium]|nr:hypothetical protein [Opitutales bacterium]